MRRARLTSPDQDPACFISGHPLGEDEFVSDGVKRRIVQPEFVLQRGIRQPSLVPEQRDH
jgi:hypothetical protein